MQTTILRIAAAVLALGALGACGDTFGEQALLGAGAGAGTAAVLDGNILAGAAVGGAANVAYCQTYPDKC
ncbi:hypothetical protein D6850_08590 [Roseovarius spongiae]|uniref:Lipoprotein n=1 Tax=Roseovarius spongiae TaxID=2320272 RepID=A0A3A8B9H8_9RHOB|nr:hypothetical protein [Roseovarius spongiae]RKF14915.1 hypothetical protein D6850_08590 [Roseovarius spongiae]